MLIHSRDFHWNFNHFSCDDFHIFSLNGAGYSAGSYLRIIISNTYLFCVSIFQFIVYDIFVYAVFYIYIFSYSIFYLVSISSYIRELLFDLCRLDWFSVHFFCFAYLPDSKYGFSWVKCNFTLKFRLPYLAFNEWFTMVPCIFLLSILSIYSRSLFCFTAYSSLWNRIASVPVVSIHPILYSRCPSYGKAIHYSQFFLLLWSSWCFSQDLYIGYGVYFLLCFRPFIIIFFRISRSLLVNLTASMTTRDRWYFL